MAVTIQEALKQKTRNTLVSDINELLVGYFLNNERWYNSEAREKYNQRSRQVSSEDLDRATEHARVMAKAFLKYAKEKNYSNITNVYWTARAGSMTELIGVEVDQTKNPTDTLIKFSSGPSDGWLGLSAKSTKGRGEIGFKNPGVGTIDRVLNISITKFYNDELEKIISKLDLPKSATERKKYIRDNPEIKKQTEVLGSKLLSKMRDILLQKLQSMDNKDLFEYFMEYWLNANIMYPPYVKITGKGTKPPYTATVMEPTKNEKNDALATLDFKLEIAGNESIGVRAKGKKIFKMRFKFESEKLASSVKMSGESW